MTLQAAEPTWAYFEPADRLEVHGLDVALRRRGDGEPVLYLHGLRMTRRWLPFYDALADSCDLIVPEHPGFGDTPLPEWLEAMDDIVIHYAELVDRLELETLHVVGYSFGGWIAAELAAFYPGRLRSLTLIAPMGLRVAGHTPADVFRFTPERFADALFNGDGAAYAGYLDDGDEAENLYQTYAEMTAFARLAWNPRYDRKLDRRLERVTTRASVIAAQDDRVVPRAHAERYAELLPAARLVEVAGERAPTGHGLVAQAPERLAAAVAANVLGAW